MNIEEILKHILTEERINPNQIDQKQYRAYYPVEEDKRFVLSGWFSTIQAALDSAKEHILNGLLEGKSIPLLSEDGTQEEDTDEKYVSSHTEGILDKVKPLLSLGALPTITANVKDAIKNFFNFSDGKLTFSGSDADITNGLFTSFGGFLGDEATKDTKRTAKKVLSNSVKVAKRVSGDGFDLDDLYTLMFNPNHEGEAFVKKIPNEGNKKTKSENKDLKNWFLNKYYSNNMNNGLFKSTEPVRQQIGNLKENVKLNDINKLGLLSAGLAAPFATKAISDAAAPTNDESNPLAGAKDKILDFFKWNNGKLFFNGKEEDVTDGMLKSLGFDELEGEAYDKNKNLLNNAVKVAARANQDSFSLENLSTVIENPNHEGEVVLDRLVERSKENEVEENKGLKDWFLNTYYKNNHDNPEFKATDFLRNKISNLLDDTKKGDLSKWGLLATGFGGSALAGLANKTSEADVNTIEPTDGVVRSTNDNTPTNEVGTVNVDEAPVEEKVSEEEKDARVAAAVAGMTGALDVLDEDGNAVEAEPTKVAAEEQGTTPVADKPKGKNKNKKEKDKVAPVVASVNQDAKAPTSGGVEIARGVGEGDKDIAASVLGKADTAATPKATNTPTFGDRIKDTLDIPMKSYRDPFGDDVEKTRRKKGGIGWGKYLLGAGAVGLASLPFWAIPYKINPVLPEEVDVENMPGSYRFYEKVELPDATKANDTFEGWYSDPEFNNKVDHIQFGLGTKNLYPRFASDVKEEPNNSTDNSSNTANNPSQDSNSTSNVALNDVQTKVGKLNDDVANLKKDVDGLNDLDFEGVELPKDTTVESLQDAYKSLNDDVNALKNKVDAGNLNDDEIKKAEEDANALSTRLKDVQDDVKNLRSLANNAEEDKDGNTSTANAGSDAKDENKDSNSSSNSDTNASSGSDNASSNSGTNNTDGSDANSGNTGNSNTTSASANNDNASNTNSGTTANANGTSDNATSDANGNNANNASSNQSGNSASGDKSDSSSSSTSADASNNNQTGDKSDTSSDASNTSTSSQSNNQGSGTSASSNTNTSNTGDKAGSGTSSSPSQSTTQDYSQNTGDKSGVGSSTGNKDYSQNTGDKSGVGGSKAVVDTHAGE